MDVLLLADQRKGDPHRQGGVFITLSPGNLNTLRKQCETGTDEWCANFRHNDVFQDTTRFSLRRRIEIQNGAPMTVYLYGYTRDGTQLLRLPKADSLGRVTITRY
jgi:hypothetical protein